jgi:hypothetical protein
LDSLRNFELFLDDRQLLFFSESPATCNDTQASEQNHKAEGLYVVIPSEELA